MSYKLKDGKVRERQNKETKQKKKDKGKNKI